MKNKVLKIIFSIALISVVSLTRFSLLNTGVTLATTAEMILNVSDFTSQSADYREGYNLGFTVGYADGLNNKMMNNLPPLGMQIRSQDFQKGYIIGYMDGYIKGRYGF